MTVYRLPTPEFRFRKFGAALITPSDTADARNLVDSVNKLRVRYVQAKTDGEIVFRHSDDTLSVAIPVFAAQSYELGTDVVHIMESGTTPGLEIIPLWA